MNEFEAYRSYISLKNHFNVPTYDCFKHRPNVTERSYEARKDQAAFQKLAKRPKPREFILANMLVDPECFPVGLAMKTAEDNYADWERRTESLFYIFKQDLAQLKPSFDANVTLDNDTPHPYLLKALIRQSISIETATILVEMTNAAPYWEGRIGGDILWEEWKLRLTKYSPFLSYNVDQYRAALVSAFSKGDE